MDQFRKKKSLGQNFLKSKSAIRSVVRAGEIQEGDTILEIGPGKGVLTKALLETPADIIAVEKDDRLIPELNQTFEKEIESGRLKIIHGDFLSMSISEILGEKSYKVIANIPYYITGQLFRKLLEEERSPTRMVVLVQKEVAERIVARDGKESILSLSVKAYGVPKIIEKVSKKMFSPPPKVDSAILLISSISKNFFDAFSEETFFSWIHAGFAQKRKKLIRNLETVETKENLEKIFTNLSLNTNARAEEVSLLTWKNILTGK